MENLSEIQLLVNYTKKVALVHWVSVYKSEHGAKRFSAADIFEEIKGGVSVEGVQIILSLEEVETILNELKNWTFVSKSEKEPFTYILQFTRTHNLFVNLDPNIVYPKISPKTKEKC
jgi:hypothetical protein